MARLANTDEIKNKGSLLWMFGLFEGLLLMFTLLFLVIMAFPQNINIESFVNTLALIWNIEVVKNVTPSPQNDPCAKLKMEPSFFKINLPRGITEQTFTTVDLCLPSYKSETNYHNPFYNDPQFKETVSLVQKKIEDNPKDIIVLAGVSGGGKTSTTFGIAMERWSIYIDFSPTVGQYGSHAGAELGDIRTKQPKFEQYDQQDYAYRKLNTIILSRGLLLIKMITERKILTPKEWLFLQLKMNDSEIRDTLGPKNYNNLTVVTLINRINAFLKVDYLTLIFDEAQILCRSEYGEYQGSSINGKRWNLLQGYIVHLTQLPVTCLLVGTYMHMASGISLVTSVGKVSNLYAHIVLKLPFLSHDDVLRNLDAVIDLTDVTPEIRDYLG
ncbi:11980_t:CDS:1, partial [Acaulospora morrowiae]